MNEDGRPVIVIVGPCASGKTTLARNLNTIGYNARVSGQEHSEIRMLWQRIGADIVIALRIDLDTLRMRRGASWPESLYETQLRRLSSAYAAADLILDTVALSEEEALRVTVAFLESIS